MEVIHNIIANDMNSDPSSVHKPNSGLYLELYLPMGIMSIRLNKKSRKKLPRTPDTCQGHFHFLSKNKLKSGWDHSCSANFNSHSVNTLKRGIRRDY